MKIRQATRDVRENRAERQKKLGSASETLPAKSLANQTGASRRIPNARTSLQPAQRGITKRASRTKEEAAGSPANPALKSGGTESIVTLRLAAPDAAQVMIAGSFSAWTPQRMCRGEPDNGEWKIDLHLGPGRYEYRFVVDGAWTDDPGAAVFIANGFGGRNAVLVVSG